jgi:polar amino acid transport system substrate-binding protein
MRKSLSFVAMAATIVAVAIAGCGSPKTTKAAAFSPAACTPSKLKTHVPGVLTLATDSPAYTPYFVDNKPSNGKGFEGAVAYAIAKQLGYSKSKVKWVVEPFDSSYAPGPKNFDFDINEISITAPRQKAVDLSIPYYSDPQGIIVSTAGPYAHVKTLAELVNAKFGVQVSTTSLAAVLQDVKPKHEPDIFNNSNDVVEAFKIGSVQAIVTDLATDEYLASSELKHAVVVGKFNAPTGNDWGVLLSKGSSLLPCVNHAIRTLTNNGTLAALHTRWIPQDATIPFLKK